MIRGRITVKATRLPMINCVTDDKNLISDDFIEKIKYWALKDAEDLHT